jgi:hypothetical protein
MKTNGNAAFQGRCSLGIVKGSDRLLFVWIPATTDGYYSNQNTSYQFMQIYKLFCEHQSILKIFLVIDHFFNRESSDILHHEMQQAPTAKKNWRGIEFYCRVGGIANRGLTNRIGWYMGC